MQVRWGPSRQARALLVVALVGLGTAVAAHRVELLAVGLPSLWALLSAPRGPEATRVTVHALRQVRAVEGDPVDLSVEMSLDRPAAWFRAELALPPALDGGLVAVGEGRRLVVDGAPVVRRWGKHRPGPVRVELLGRGALRGAVVDVPLDLEVLALPRPSPLQTGSAPPDLPDQLGEHVTRSIGFGVEPVGVRAHVPGDSLRRINWAVTSRRDTLHVTVAAAERSVDLVVVVDALASIGTPPDTTLDRAVRTAAGVAQRWLRDRDRVGLVVLGGALRWLTPASGRIQEQRIGEAVLMAWAPPGQVSPEVARVPRSVLPDGAIVVLVSPLVDDRAFDAAEALRRRANRVVVIDILAQDGPAVDLADPLAVMAARLWRLERAASVTRMERRGVPVIASGTGDLDRLLSLAVRRPA